MKKLRLDFQNRIVNIVTDQKTVIAYMDDELEKESFRTFFPDERTYNTAINVTFDFENGLLCLKKPVRPARISEGSTEEYQCVKKIPIPSIGAESRELLGMVGWDED